MIAGLLFMAGMRRSEVSALHWADVADAADGDGVLVTVRRSKTNQEGETTDVRFVKGGVARAIRTLRAAATPGPADRVAPLSPKMVGLRFQAAARAAGVERVTAHSRVVCGRGRDPTLSVLRCPSVGARPAVFSGQVDCVPIRAARRGPGI